MSDATPEIDRRIEVLENEHRQLRKRMHDSNNDTNAILLGQKTIELGLANQDRVLAKLEKCINGNGEPGLKSRMDRVEMIQHGFSRVAWMLGGLILVSLAGAVLALLHIPVIR